MKHLLRKRTNSTSSPSPSGPSHSSSSSHPRPHGINVSAPVPLGPYSSPASPATPDTPLYARFATGAKPVVSGPMTLAPRRAGVGAGAGQVPAPPQVQRGSSSQSQSQSQSDRERERDMEREREREQAAAADRQRERERERKKSQAAQDKDKVRGILKRVEPGPGPALEGPSRAAAQTQGRGEAEAEREGGMGRGPSTGAGASADAGGVAGGAGAGAGVGVGMHGARVQGERVLLPARKVTQRRAGRVGVGEEARDEDARARRENSPVKVNGGGGGAESGAGLHHRHLHHQHLHQLDVNPNGELYSQAHRQHQQEQEQEQQQSHQYQQHQRQHVHQHTRSTSDRVLLPARKVAQAQTQTQVRRHVDDDGTPAQAAAGSSSSPSASGRPPLVEGVFKEAWAPTSSSLTGTSSNPTPKPPQQVVFPAPARAAPAPAPAPAPTPVTATTSPGARTDHGGWEDRFSTPKRAHIVAVSTGASAGAVAGGGEAAQAPRTPKDSDGARAAGASEASCAISAPSVAASSASSPYPSSPFASSQGPPAIAASSSAKARLHLHADEDEDGWQPWKDANENHAGGGARVVGDRVLLPARKVTRRIAAVSEGEQARAKAKADENPNENTNENEKAWRQREGEMARERERSPERGRTMSTGTGTGRARMRQEKQPPLQATTTTATATATHAYDASDSDPDPDLVAAPAKAARLYVVNAFPSPSASPAGSARELALGPEHAAVVLQGMATSPSTSTSTNSNPNPKPIAPSLASQPSTSSVEATSANNTNGRPPRRRKYSLLAAFGLPSRAASDSESSSTPAASSSVAHDAKPPTLTPHPAPPPDSATPLLPPSAVDSVTSASSAGVPESEKGPRERVPSTTRRPPAELQLHSLHLSGFNFPLDALLGDAPDADREEPPPLPALPPSEQRLSQPSVSVSPPSPSASKRQSIVDSAPLPRASPSPSPPDRPAPAATSRTSPGTSSASLGPPSKAQSPYRAPSPPPLSQPAATAAPPEAHARPVPAPAPHSQAQKAKTKTRPIDLDQSLLPPESDTRYPLPSRRSPTAHPSHPNARPQKHEPPNKSSLSRSSPTRSPPMKSDQPIAIPNARGPVQGRPLIFAAMAAAELEAEIVDPRAWMAVPTYDPDSPDDTDVKNVRTEHSNGSSQFVNGYPTPRSASPKLPAASSSDEGHGLPAFATSTGTMHAAREDLPRRSSPSLPQSPPTAPGSLPTPPEIQPTRARKLSKAKSRVTRMTEASQAPSQPSTQALSQPLSNGHAPNTLGAKPPTPVEDAPPVRTRDGPPKSVPKPSPASIPGSSPNPSSSSTPSLASPFQMRGDKNAMERRHVESRSPPRVISSESPVPTRPVKVLTERQMEKLSATKGVPMHGSNGNGHSSQRRPEQPVPVKSPPLRHKQLSPLTPPDEPPAAHHSRNRSIDDSLPPPPPKKRPTDVSTSSPQPGKASLPEPPLSPTTPEEYARARSRRRGHALEKSRPEGIENITPAVDEPEPAEPEEQPEEEPKEPTFYPLEQHVAEPALLGLLVGYLPFSDWLALSSVSKTIRSLLYDDRELTERVLERYLRTVGYARWAFPESEPIALTLADLNAYMHGVSVPQHQFARYAEQYIQHRHPRQRELVWALQAACRAYTRVVLRLRAQAEAEARIVSAMARDRARSPARAWGGSTSSVNHVSSQHPYPTPKKSFSRSSSRAPSPTSMFSRSQHSHGQGYGSGYGHSRSGSFTDPSLHHNPSIAQFHGAGTPLNTNGNGVGGFQSPLFRIRRAPLLQVFVPSPEGDWLSDASVLECEQELRRAGVAHLLRAGDVVWDTAVGDEGNVGRMVWDGSYLIDLDYTYSRAGDLPKYLPTLAFPPSYFHRVVRTMGGGNPICHIDIAPWGEEIATNLQLLQDRMKTETPQGGHHMVVRWVHRSSFTIRPSSSGKPLRVSIPKCVGPGPGPGGVWLVDPGWYGTVVVEAEGTNEGLADLQERCRGAFPIRAVGAGVLSVSPERAAREEERRMVFRILREKSRPGEIWIKTVTAKERLLPP